MRPADTSPDAERVQLDLLRRASVAQRARLARSLSATTLWLARRAIREANPTLSEDELSVKLVAHLYGPELAEGVRQRLDARRASPDT